MACDFRFQKDALKGLNYSICGLGNSLYQENFNKVAVDLDKSISSLQATRLAPIYLCDENTIKSKHGSLEGDVAFWQNNFFEKLNFFANNSDKAEPEELDSVSCCQSREASQDVCCSSTNSQSKANGKTCCKTNGFHDNVENGVESSEYVQEKYEDTTEDENENGEEDNEDYFSENDEMLSDAENGETLVNIGKKVKVKNNGGVVDMEDLGTVIKSINKKKNTSNPPKEMITPLLRKSLEKQGYKLIGSHSGVKLCRWTKSMLRGRGGCYKHTFYGIESHRW